MESQRTTHEPFNRYYNNKLLIDTGVLSYRKAIKDDKYGCDSGPKPGNLSSHAPCFNRTMPVFVESNAYITDNRIYYKYHLIGQYDDIFCFQNSIAICIT